MLVTGYWFIRASSLEGQAFLPLADILITCICLVFSHVGKGNGEDNRHPRKKIYVHE